MTNADNCEKEEKDIVKAEKAIEKAEKETGFSRDQQMQVFNQVMILAKNALDLKNEQEKTKQLQIRANRAEIDSQREFILANRRLDVMEKVLTNHFAERKSQIEEGFQMIDKALEEGNWDGAARVFGDMSAMVAKSPLAAAIELNDKMKSGKAITLDDF